MGGGALIHLQNGWQQDCCCCCFVLNGFPGLSQTVSQQLRQLCEPRAHPRQWRLGTEGGFPFPAMNVPNRAVTRAPSPRPCFPVTCCLWSQFTLRNSEVTPTLSRQEREWKGHGLGAEDLGMCSGAQLPRGTSSPHLSIFQNVSPPRA